MPKRARSIKDLKPGDTVSEAEFRQMMSGYEASDDGTMFITPQKARVADLSFAAHRLYNAAEGFNPKDKRRKALFEIGQLLERRHGQRLTRAELVPIRDTLQHLSQRLNRDDAVRDSNGESLAMAGDIDYAVEEIEELL